MATPHQAAADHSSHKLSEGKHVSAEQHTRHRHGSADSVDSLPRRGRSEKKKKKDSRASGMTPKTKCLLAIAVLLSPLWLSLVGLWTAIGLLVSVTPAALAAVCWVVTVLLFVGTGLSLPGGSLGSQFSAYTWLDSWADVPVLAAATAALLLVLAHTFPRRETPSRVAIVVVWAAFMSFTVAKAWSASDLVSASSTGFALSLLWFSAVWVSILGLSATRWWRPVTQQRLDASEESILLQTMRTPFVRRRVAGMSTLEVVPELLDDEAHNFLVTPGGTHTRVGASTSDCKASSPLVQSGTPPVGPSAVQARFGDHRRTVVFIHGFGAGNAFWGLNINALAQSYNVYAVDWRGCGASLREPFTAKTAKQAEAWFVEGLERWRDAHPNQAHHLQKFVVVAHSLGAMIASAYTLKHPDRVSQLILASPCGVPDAPERRDIPQAFRVIGYLWARGWTPHRIARWMGPIGPWFMRKLVEKRTSWMSPQSSINDGTLDKQLVAKYLYQSWASPRSGEAAMNTLLKPGAYAVHPLRHRFIVPETGAVHPSLKNVSMTFIYGGRRDWMDQTHGEELVEEMRAAGKRDVDLRSVHKGGHQLFVNRPEAFNQEVLAALAAFEEAAQANQGGKGSQRRRPGRT